MRYFAICALLIAAGLFSTSVISGRALQSSGLNIWI